MNQITLFEKSLFIQNPLVKSPGVLSETEGGVRPKELRQIDRVDERVRDGKGGPAGINIDRTDIEFEMGCKLLQVKAADAVNPDP
jgi:hypothetical protein